MCVCVCMCMPVYHIFFIHLTVDGHLGGTHILATVNNAASILKSRDITLPTKVRLVKAMVFPVVMYGCESWTVKKAECQKIDAFELWCWRKDS